MDYSIKQQQKRKIAGFHLVGPWEQTVKQGFEQLVMWVDGRHIEPLEWVAVYYDNPDEVPAKNCAAIRPLRCRTILYPGKQRRRHDENRGGIMPWRRRVVENYDFATPWYQFFNSLLQDNKYQMALKPCFERYLNDGNADGWDIEMYIAVEHKRLSLLNGFFSRERSARLKTQYNCDLPCSWRAGVRPDKSLTP
jgi:DNA gyrase inhibitor